jgi:hypothetical protein
LSSFWVRNTLTMIGSSSIRHRKTRFDPLLPKIQLKIIDSYIILFNNVIQKYSKKKRFFYKINNKYYKLTEVSQETRLICDRIETTK